ncbi:MAG TPA: SMC family ATPase [Actinomycetota bacterium]|nr:SMC family ATPase [Actinomycetota bacterium]
MRPTRLELEGFTAFKQPTVVDFDGCDFFALCGQTGAGKSSIIDAISFALYGSIPRLDRNDVRSVISQGLLECKVRLDFTIGETAYTAVRVVARTKIGATTREARLQRGAETLAGDAKAVSAAVEGLIGLTFEQFTKCVVLPQGEFARFLHDKPADRQDLLVKLLGYELYERMGRRANELARRAGDQAEWLAKRLEDEFIFATPESRTEAAERLATLDAVRVRVEDATPGIEALDADAKEAKAEAAAARARLDRLAKVSVPDGAGALAGAVARARDAREAAEAEAERTDAARRAAEAALEALPQRSVLEIARQAHADRAKCETQRTQVMAALEALGRVAGEAAVAFDAAVAAMEAAERALEAARIQHRAHDLARSLVAGDPCPVCKQTVSTLPGDDVPADLHDAERALEQARAAREDADRNRRKAADDKTRAEVTADELTATLDELTRRVADHPDPDQLDRALTELESAEREAADARRAGDAARRAATDAQRRLDGAMRAEQDARKGFDQARDALADLSPPPASRDDLAADWEELAAWAATQHAAQAAAADAADRRVEEILEQRRARAGELLAAARDAGIEVPHGVKLSEACMQAVVSQRAVLERIEAALIQMEDVAAQRKTAEEEQAVASTLGRHLSASNFEKWLLDEAMQRLVESASRVLRELSAGGYSLAVDGKGNFAVIDHRNADEQRSAKTLSGGETFLASLSLALALSEDLAGMAAEGARLDAIFLDEGFGTLDPETLGVVQSAIESLASQGRMVGLVTHVREIADYVPVRFEVRKHPDTSRVEKVDA